MGNGTVESTWTTCVGCAILHRSFGKTETSIPDVCQICLQKFCWDGSVDNPGAKYHPKPKIRSFRKSDSGESGTTNLSADISAALAMMMLFVAFFC